MKERISVRDEVGRIFIMWTCPITSAMENIPCGIRDKLQLSPKVNTYTPSFDHKLLI
jgi:hypothetical protein